MKTLSEFTTLQEAREYSNVTYSDMSTSVLNSFIGGFNLASFVEGLEDDLGKMLNATRAANGKFCFDENDVIGASCLSYLDYLIQANPSQATELALFKEAAIDFCKEETTPYAETTLKTFNKAKGVYTSILAEKPDSASLNIEVTGCEERCQAVVYGMSEDYDEPQNLGVVAWGTTKFVFNLAGVQFTSLELRFPFEGVEVV